MPNKLGIFPSILLIFLIFSIEAKSQSAVEWFNFRSEKEMTDLAKSRDKLIFVDAYASWCTTCKVMDKEVFGLGDVSEYFNEHYVNYKMDIYSVLGRQLARKHQVVFLPALLILDEQGNLVSKIEGRRNVFEVMEWAGGYVN